MITPAKCSLQRIVKQGADMWDLLEYEVAVAAVNGLEVNVRIEDAHLAPLADQLLE